MVRAQCRSGGKFIKRYILFALFEPMHPSKRRGCSAYIGIFHMRSYAYARLRYSTPIEEEMLFLEIIYAGDKSNIKCSIIFHILSNGGNGAEPVIPVTEILRRNFCRSFT